MRNTSVLRTAAWGLALGFALTGSGVQADPWGEKEVKDKKIERHVVIIDEDGKQRVIENGQPVMWGGRGYLGTGLTEITPELRTHFGVKGDAGVLVSKVEPGSPAEKAGIRVGDVITAVDGVDVKSSWDLRGKIRKGEDGQTVPIEVWRNGKVQTVTAAIEERERQELDMAPFFMKHGEGDQLMFRLDKDKLMHGLPENIHIEGLEGTGDGERRVHVRRLGSPREAELEKKLKDLEKRLADLEKLLEKK